MTPLTPPPWIVMNETNCKTATLRSVSQSLEILLPSNRRQIGSNKLLEEFFLDRMFFQQHHKSKNIITLWVGGSCDQKGAQERTGKVPFFAPGGVMRVFVG